MAIPNRFSAVLRYCDSTHIFASCCGISVDSRPAIENRILGIGRFAICDSVPLRTSQYIKTLFRKISQSQKTGDVQNCLQWGRSNLVDPAGSPKIRLLNRDFGNILSNFPRKNKTQSSLNFL